jgi:hypothetical protein
MNEINNPTGETGSDRLAMPPAFDCTVPRKHIRAISTPHKRPNGLNGAGGVDCCGLLRVSNEYYQKRNSIVMQTKAGSK